jgi:hypothetical protein
MREEVHGAVLAGCGATMNPQTRDEYRQAIASGVPSGATANRSRVHDGVSWALC